MFVDVKFLLIMTNLVQILSGRKKESSIWNSFIYNETSNKSRCVVLMDNGDECGCEITGKKTSNLKTHVKSRHPELFKLIIQKDQETAEATFAAKKRKHSATEGNSNSFVVLLRLIVDFLLPCVTGYSCFICGFFLNFMQLVYLSSKFAHVSDSVVDWLTGDISAGPSTRDGSGAFKHYKQHTLKAFVGSRGVWAKDSVEYQMRLHAVRDMIIGSLSPVSLTNQPDFRKMLHIFDHKFTLPGTRCIFPKICFDLYVQLCCMLRC